VTKTAHSLDDKGWVFHDWRKQALGMLRQLPTTESNQKKLAVNAFLNLLF